MRWHLLCSILVPVCLTSCGLTERDRVDVAVGCTLATVASGELPAAAGLTSRFSGPGLAATHDSFVLVWRENMGKVDRMTVSRLSDDGAFVEVEVVEVEGCASSPLPTGLGAASSTEPPPTGTSPWYAQTGVAVTALKNCGSHPPYGGHFVVPFNGQYALIESSASGNSDQEILTSAQPVAPTLKPREHYSAFVQKLEAKTAGVIGRLHGNSFRDQPPPHLIDVLDGATPGYINLTSSESLLAVAGSIPADGAVRLHAFAHTWPPEPIGQRTFPLTDWVSLTAWGSQVALLAPSPQGPAVTVVEASTATMAELVSDRLEAPSPTAGAIATLRDRLLVATASGNTISLQQSSVLSLSAEAAAKLSPGGYQGKLLALAAARERVAVAWLNESSVAAGNSPGGWAVFECAE